MFWGKKKPQKVRSFPPIITPAISYPSPEAITTTSFLFILQRYSKHLYNIHNNKLYILFYTQHFSFNISLEVVNITACRNA